ncbi:MAG: ISC system 2Fe-2S type ferredoxin [Burkholderiaceae bacterium]
MPTVTVLPHDKLCPQGASIELAVGDSLCEGLLRNGIAIEHACEMSCACTTCHVIVREGFDALEPSEDDEDDMLDKAWGLSANSRLSCQVRITDEDMTVEIPRYTINHAREDHE